MKLLTKTTLYFLIAMIPLLAVAGFFLFQQFGRELDHRMDEELVSDEVKWIRYLQAEVGGGSSFVLRTPYLLIYPVNATTTTYPAIDDAEGFVDNDKVLYRQLTHVVAINGIPYQIVIRKSQEQKAVLKANITRIMLFVFVGLFMATLIFNWAISQNLWRPFRLSLEKIRGAELPKMEAIRFEKTNIEEFNELNSSLNIMAGKIYSDYINMKEFTENAAHEMQTPLAVAQSKIELLLQDANLTDEQVEAIMQANTALMRLSKLNQSLLLLAKIENHQYETTAPISLKDITLKYLKLFDEMIKDKRLTIDTNYAEDFVINLHPLLADSLISNLIGNAIKYNYEGGKISISISDSQYHISNTSSLPAIEQQQLFKRFNKSNNMDSSTGLGLAIVKKIADTHHFDISYKAENGLHHFYIEKER
jgi:signal transduction histidine kinase